MLSKTNYKRYLICDTMLWYHKNHYTDLLPVDLVTQETFDQGRQFEDYAQLKILKELKIDKPFTIKGFKPYEYKEMMDATEAAIYDDSVNMVFEAAFSNHVSAFAMIDCLEILREGNEFSYNITEIKNSSEVKTAHIADVSFQVWVLRSSGQTVNKVSIAHRNPGFMRKEKHSTDESLADGLVVIEDVTEKVNKYLKKNSDIFKKKTIEANKINKGSKKPDNVLTNKCKTCQAREMCIPDIKEPSTLNLLSFSWRLKNSLLKEGIFYLKDFFNKYEIEKLKLTRGEKIALECHRDNKEVFNKASVREHLTKLKFPLYSFDFETVSSVIPLYSNSRPNQQIPFEASIHKLNEDGSIEHFIYLHEKKTDPREEMIQFLTSKFNDDEGSIVVFNEDFEKKVLKELGYFDPNFAKYVPVLLTRIWDLQTPYKNRDIYIKEFMSGWSLKSITKNCLAKNYYEGEVVSDGAEAFIGYLRYLRGEMDENTIDSFFKGLLRYNGLDTMIPLIIIKKLFERCDLELKGLRTIKEDLLENL